MKKSKIGMIGTKLLIFSIIIVLIPITMLSYVSSDTISELMISNQNSELNTNIGILNERLDNVFVEFDTMTAYTAQLPIVIDAVKNKDEETLQNFANGLEDQSWVDLATFTDADGNVICASYGNTDAKISTYVKKLIEKDTIYAYDVISNEEASKYSDYELDGYDALAIFTVAPVYDGESLIGTVTYVDIMNKDDYWVDRVKEVTGDEASIYLNNVRISTTCQKNGVDLVGEIASETAYESVLKNQDYVGKVIVDGNSYFGKYSPIYDIDGEVIGMICVGTPEMPFVILMNSVIRKIFFIAFSSLIVAVLVAFILNRKIVVPIKKLKNSAEIFGHGKYDERVSLKTGDELEELAESFNKMADEISRADKKLKKDADELKNSYDELKEVDNLKSELLSIVSHELRTPLTSIRGYVDLLKDETAGKLNDKQHEFILIISENSDRLKRLIDNMLDLVKVENEVLDFKFNKLNIKNTVGEIISSLKYFADSKNIILLEDVDEVYIKGDKSKINQVLANLIENAIKFSKNQTKVTVIGFEDKENLHLEITDQGPGIPKENLEKIFEKFYQIDSSSKREIGGSGLGLAVCKKIVESHGGSIWVESKVGKGTSVHILLPIAK
ncbi:integral membrane sensor signal transduction histidine kinase [Methanococcus maripaludis C5]|uniref:histidine kinase n=1 Tax=Methanococcus maripaludis (strain C5 / ATCC BAA-1333) TaxID=402880 RepID=A4FX50_METM5|nr:ATP-binding protein [Methanococcus maripaludis]ABO34779.1 integral membrane sensor signal transduction histidine kinase [Methanococcus maripaludis C5]